MKMMVVMRKTFISDLRSLYVPNEALTVDEQFIEYRGKIPGRTYMPSNPRQYGVKFFGCAMPQQALLSMA